MKLKINYYLEEEEIKLIKEQMQSLKISYEDLSKKYGTTRQNVFSQVAKKKVLTPKLLNVLIENLNLKVENNKLIKK